MLHTKHTNSDYPFKYNMPGYREVFGDEESLAGYVAQLTRGAFPLNASVEMVVHGELYDELRIQLEAEGLFR